MANYCTAVVYTILSTTVYKSKTFEHKIKQSIIFLSSLPMGWLDSYFRFKGFMESTIDW